LSQLGRDRRLRTAGVTRKRGAALLFSLTLVAVVTASGLMLLQLNIARARRQGQATDNKRAIYIAEAGIAEAFLAVVQGRSGSIASQATPARFANGIYWVEATEGADGQVALKSTGLCRTGRFAISVVVERVFDPIASLGLFGGNELIVGEGAVVDGYDSRIGSPLALSALLQSAGEAQIGAQLGSNGDAFIEASLLEPTMVFGSVSPGPGHAVTIEPGGEVTGSTLPTQAVVLLPELEAPPLTSAGDLEIARGRKLTVPSGEYRHGRVTVAAGQTLTLEGPCVLILDHLELEPGAELAIDSKNGTVTLYVRESLRIPTGASLTSSSVDPTAFVLLIDAADPVDINGDGSLEMPVVFAPSGEFAGFIYAPYTDVVVPSDLHLMGGLVAGSLTLAPGARMSFDSALKAMDITLTGLPRLVAWRIVALPNVPLVSLREDPLRQLDRDGVTPVESGYAASESYMRVVYYDGVGTKQSYEGFVSSFDWSAVKTVEKLRWFESPGVNPGKWIKPSRVAKSLFKAST